MKTDNTNVPAMDLRAMPRGADDFEWRFDSLKNESFDPVSLWERVNGDAELLRDLVELFIQEFPRILQSLKTALDQGSSADVHKLSHKLKGSVLQFSGLESVVLAGKLEEMGKTKALEGADQVFAQLEKAVDALVADLRSMVDPEGPVI